jgi:cation transport protein ChaC
MSGPWIFGYGSLVWRPAFKHQRREPAYIEGFERRFWQASPLHRGTEEQPGRVVTLLPKASARCWGMAYQVHESEVDAILTALDHRERTGYARVRTTLHVRGVGPIEDVLLYVASPENRNYIGPESHETTAAIIRHAHGESGANQEYLQKLAQGLDEMQVEDPHILELVALLARTPEDEPPSRGP